MDRRERPVVVVNDRRRVRGLAARCAAWRAVRARQDVCDRRSPGARRVIGACRRASAHIARRCQPDQGHLV